MQIRVARARVNKYVSVGQNPHYGPEDIPTLPRLLPPNTSAEHCRQTLPPKLSQKVPGRRSFKACSVQWRPAWAEISLEVSHQTRIKNMNCNHPLQHQRRLNLLACCSLVEGKNFVALCALVVGCFISAELPRIFRGTSANSPTTNAKQHKQTINE